MNPINPKDPPNDQPPPPPTLPYRNPREDPRPNSASWFILRAAIGLSVGVVTLVLGGFLAARLNSIYLVFVPWAATLLGAIAYTIWKRRFGYITGLLIGLIIPLVIV